MPIISLKSNEVYTKNHIAGKPQKVKVKKYLSFLESDQHLLGGKGEKDFSKSLAFGMSMSAFFIVK